MATFEDFERAYTRVERGRKVGGLTAHQRKILNPEDLDPPSRYSVNVVHNGLGQAKQRVVNLLADTTNGVKFIVHNQSVNNAARAVMERVFLVKDQNGKFTRPPKMKPGVLSRLSRFKQIMADKSVVTSPYTRQQFVDCYKGRRHTIYQNALNSLRIEPLCKLDFNLRSFIKNEKINSLTKSNPVPRIIQPRNPRFNIEIGRYIKRVEKLVYSAITESFGSPSNTPIVSKGYNASALGDIMCKKWNTFLHPVAVGLDASRFDQHCGKEILEWEHEFYFEYFRGTKYFEFLCSRQLQNHGTVWCRDGSVSYDVEGCRMSGDMNTGLGNCVIMCGLVHTMMYELDLEGKFEFINNGDDCVIIVEEEHLELLSNSAAWFLDFGYTMKVEPPVRVFERIEFCQTQPVYDGNQYVMCRKPQVVMTKDFTSLKNVNTVGAWRFYCQAISDCGIAAYGNIPVLGAMYNVLNVGGRRSKKFKELNGGLEWMAHGMTNTLTEPHYLSRVSFFRAFGITPDHQVGIEEWYNNQTLRYNPGPLLSITKHTLLPIETNDSIPTRHTTTRTTQSTHTHTF